MAPQILDAAEWQARQLAHEARVRPWVDPRLERMSRQERHPVEDFLFEYYSLRPGQLMRWHPGVGVVLTGEGSRDFLVRKGYMESGGGVHVGPPPPERKASIRWIHNLLVQTASRPGAWGCHGLHEWAMVYRAPEVRHSGWPLRLSREETAAVVESLTVRCSHFDAFRFFTPEARPLNRLQPSRGGEPDFEQPACLHANMDLYKWTYKLLPFCPSEMVADAFELAREIRELDMRASPYDLSALGYDPVPIETAAGRALYEEMQRDFAGRAAPLRQRLIRVCEETLALRETPALSVTQ